MEQLENIHVNVRVSPNNNKVPRLTISNRVLHPSVATLSSENLCDHNFVVFSKMDDRVYTPIQNNITPSTQNTQLVTQVSNDVCFGVPAASLKEFLQLKMSRSISLALLMILMPYGSGCPTALLRTTKQGGMGFGKQTALHSSQQPGVAVYLNQAPMASCLEQLIRRAIQLTRDSLTSIIEASGITDSKIAIRAAFLFDWETLNILINAKKLPKNMKESLKSVISFQKKVKSIFKSIQDDRIDFNIINILKNYKQALLDLENYLLIDESCLNKTQGYNLLEQTSIELAHASVDILPTELNRWDADIVESLMRQRLENLQHASALKEKSPDELCLQYMSDFSLLMARTSDYIKITSHELSNLPLHWNEFCADIAILKTVLAAVTFPLNKADQNKIRVAYYELLRKGVFLYRFGQQLASHCPDAEEKAAVSELTSTHVDKVFERLNNPSLYRSIKDIPNTNFGMSEISKFGRYIHEIINPFITTAIEGIQLSLNIDLDEARQQLFTVISLDDHFLDSRLLPLNLKLDGSDGKALEKKSANWMEKSLIPEVNHLSFNVAAQSITLKNLKNLYQSVKLSNSDENLVCEFLLNSFAYFQKPLPRSLRKLVDPYMDLTANIFSNNTFAALGLFGAIFNTASHNCAVFDNKNLYTFGRPPSAPSGSTVLKFQPNDPAFLHVDHFTKTTFDITHSLLELLQELDTIPDVDLTQNAQILKQRVSTALYIGDILNQALTNPHITYDKKIAIKAYLKKLVPAEILTGVFIRLLQPLIFPNITDIKSARNGKIASSLALLTLLCAGCPQGKTALANELKNSLVNFDRGLNGASDDNELDPEKAISLTSQLKTFSDHVLPTYQECIDDYLSCGFYQNLETLLLSEIKADAMLPLNWNNEFRSELRSLGLPTLSIYTLLQTLQREYQTLFSGRPMPTVRGAIPHGLPWSIRGSVKLVKKTNKINNSDEHVYKLRFNIPSEILHQVFTASTLNANVEVKSSHRAMQNEKIKSLSQALVEDMSLLDKSGNYSFNAMLQPYEPLP